MLHEQYRSKWEALAVLALASAVACSKAAPRPEQGDVCGHCHSSPSSPVPFVTPRGLSDPADRGAGAHSAHLGTGKIRQALSCGDCHKVPAKVSDPDHMGVGHARVQFGELARTGGLAPSWGGAAVEGTALLCSNTWCHGGGLKAANLFSPIWTEDGEMRCDSCHGAPPPRPHPQRTDCSACHIRTVKPDGTIDIEGALHIDGIVQAPNGDCTACHGDPARPSFSAAPPIGTRGEKDTTARAVGAHQAHLQAGRLRASIACNECHVVPTDLSHIDGTPAVTFGALARSDGANPSWNSAATSCTVYCHGSTLPGGTNTTPQWTRVDGTQAACGTCHGLPPPSPHPQNTNCNSCHPGTVNPDGSLNAGGGLHINGVLDLGNFTCSSCHGSGTNPAPPQGTLGETATTDRAVGAHQSHLQAGKLRGPIACNDCHVVPTDLSHIDGTPAVTFGALARSDGANPSWNIAAASCTVYCHGSTLPGGTNTTPQWTRVDGTQAACGTCHGLPPPSPHPQNTNCNSCHPGTVNPDGSLNAGGGLHINGVINVEGLTCSSCHGSGSNPAPPVGTRGETATTDRAVGAHQSHLNAGPFARALECGECHVVPARIPHANGTVDINFGPLATTGGATPHWNGLSCSSAYCHGNFAGGNTGNAPQWTRVNGTQAACGTCHGLPPRTGHHELHVFEENIGCGTCHTGYSRTAVNISLHVNGRKDVDLAQTGWNATSRSCANRCHGTKRW